MCLVVLIGAVAFSKRKGGAFGEEAEIVEESLDAARRTRRLDRGRVGAPTRARASWCDALLAAVQCDKSAALTANLAMHGRVLEARGARAGCEIAVFPEMSLTGSVDPRSRS